MTAKLVKIKDESGAFKIKLPLSESKKLQRRGLELDKKISDLEEFLFDDYGDSVEQLGIEKVRELESELRAMKDERSEIWAREIALIKN